LKESAGILREEIERFEAEEDKKTEMSKFKTLMCKQNPQTKQGGFQFAVRAADCKAAFSDGFFG